MKTYIANNADAARLAALPTGGKAAIWLPCKHSIELMSDTDVNNPECYKVHTNSGEFTEDGETLTLMDYLPLPLNVPIYVREAWNVSLKEELTPNEFTIPAIDWGDDRFYVFKAGNEHDNNPAHHEWGKKTWKRTVTMPREAARTWLLTTAVQVKRVQEMDVNDLWDLKYNAPQSEILPYRLVLLELFKADFIAKRSQQEWDENRYIFLFNVTKVEKP